MHVREGEWNWPRASGADCVRVELTLRVSLRARGHGDAGTERLAG